MIGRPGIHSVPRHPRGDAKNAIDKRSIADIPVRTIGIFGSALLALIGAVWTLQRAATMLLQPTTTVASLLDFAHYNQNAKVSVSRVVTDGRTLTFTFQNTGTSAAANLVIGGRYIYRQDTEVGFDPFTAMSDSLQHQLDMNRRSELYDIATVAYHHSSHLTAEQYHRIVDEIENRYDERREKIERAEHFKEKDATLPASFAGLIAGASVDYSTSIAPLNQRQVLFVFGSYTYEDALGGSHSEEFCEKYGATGSIASCVSLGTIGKNDPGEQQKLCQRRRD